MSSFTNRLERDLGDIAAQAAPPPTGWAQIQQRIERQPDEPATEVVLMPLDQGPSVGQGPTTDRRGWLAAAVVLVIVAGVALVQSATDSGETTVVNQPSDGSSTATTTRSPIWSRAWSMDAAGPGTFTTTVLEPGLVVTVGDGWIPGQAESEATWNARLPQPDRPAGGGVRPAGRRGIC